MMLRAVPRAEIGRDAWEAACDALPDAWWWHRWDWCEYELAHSGGGDLSTAIIDEGEVVALTSLFDQRGRPGHEGQPAPWPAGGERGAALLVELASYHGVMPLAWLPVGWGALPLTRLSVIMHQPMSTIWAGLRKSYHQLIHRQQERYVLALTDCLGEYEWVHKQAFGGGQPRPQVTYEWQRKWLREGRAVCAVARASTTTMGRSWAGDPVAAIYVLLDKGRAYYASGPSLEPAMHALQWFVIQALQARGVTEYMLGYEGLATDAKGQGIELFKAGFGRTFGWGLLATWRG